MAKPVDNSAVKNGRQRNSATSSSSNPTSGLGVSGGSFTANRQNQPQELSGSAREWAKDDGNYADFTYKTSNKELKDWLKSKSVSSDWKKISDSFDQDTLTAIYNYSLGSGRFNTPLRENLPFIGNVNDVGKWIPVPDYAELSAGKWYKISHEKRKNTDLKITKHLDVTAKQAKKFERSLSRAFKHELDRGIIVARGAKHYAGAIPNVGDITFNKGYTSTAYGGEDWAEQLGYPLKYVIRLPKGSKVLHVSGKQSDGTSLSYHDDGEAEILIRKNSVFRTTNVTSSVNKRTGITETVIYQDFLGYGSPKKLSRRMLQGTPNYSLGKRKKPKTT